MKLIVSAPLRITLCSGGCDLPEYYSMFGGWICSVAIDKRVTVEFSDFDTDRQQTHENPIVAACFRHVGSPTCRVSVSNDVTPGSGLGGSGALAVAVITGLMAVQYRNFNRERWTHRLQLLPLIQLAHEAYIAERSVGSHVGVQDSMIAAHGGCISYSILRDGTIWDVDDPPIDFTGMAEWFLLFRTPLTRHAARPLQDLAMNITRLDVQDRLHQIRAIGADVVHAAIQGDWIEVGALFNEHWSLKKLTAESISNSQIDAWHNAAMMNGALGGKLNGAGAGGHFVFVCEPTRKDSLISAMHALGVEHVPVRYVAQGVTFRWTS